LKGLYIQPRCNHPHQTKKISGFALMYTRPESRRGEDRRTLQNQTLSHRQTVSATPKIPHDSFEVDYLIDTAEKLERRAQVQHTNIKRTLSKLHMISSSQSRLVTQLDELYELKSNLNSELVLIESEISSSQAELDAMARRKSAPREHEFESAISQLESRIKEYRERLSVGLVELLIRTDGEFIYSIPSLLVL